ncbi:hypothetical protein SUGI_0690990 [Cryptomeria japonica]|nr:hypothetical protein SUGI_0690990 [Cryptomeria japonica]
MTNCQMMNDYQTSVGSDKALRRKNKQRLCLGASGLTAREDVVILMVLKSEWQNTPPNWIGADPCGSMWNGVNCTGPHVTSLNLSNMNLSGTLPSDIGSLIGLRSIDISYNKGIKGEIPSSIGYLINLEFFLAIGCGLTGQIPYELGNLKRLSFLALNSNKLSGHIPPSLGGLGNLYWLDLSDNDLIGKLPVSNSHESGLDKLFNAKHFHLGKNQLTGPIPPEIFHCRMQLIHLLFDNNNLEGKIPSTLGLVNTLEIVRLDRNSLTSAVPSEISNLTNLFELHLSNNKLEGPIPDLSGMIRLQYVDLSNNSFYPSEAPDWFTTLPRLRDLVMENTGLTGQLPTELFDLPAIETVRLNNNDFNGTLKVDNNAKGHLQIIDLENNKITWATQPNNISLLLLGNPACDSEAGLSSSNLCRSTSALPGSYTTNMGVCLGRTCSGDLKPNPRTCHCQVPYQGDLIFISPSFSELSNASRFKELEESLMVQVFLDSVFICCLSFDNNNYLNMKVQFFPSENKYFERMEIVRIGSTLSNQIYKAPREFGPYYFMGNSYPFKDASESGSGKLSKPVIIGISVGSFVMAFAILTLGLYALHQKYKATKAIELSNHFAWNPNNKNSETIPTLNGARWFSLSELKHATNKFSENNVIGSGGCGKVYKGELSNGGGTVAIKRFQLQGFSQDGVEIKNEIEVLSRVHHRNLVALMGFCLEKGEQMLVYEYISNGTLRENLCGRGDIHMNWKTRVRIALETARGLAYLHNHANPPIIHRDVKSTNILLNEDLTAKVADFGLSKFIADGGKQRPGKGHVSTKVKGTLGYLDPEYYMSNHLTDKSDVYSFGVVMLELLTARQPIEEGKYIVREVRRVINNGGINALQKQILDPFLSDSDKLGLENFVNLALSCVEELTAHRPAMSDVVKQLECIVEERSLSGSACVEIKESSYHSPIDRDVSSEYAMFHYSGPYIVPTTIEPH